MYEKTQLSQKIRSRLEKKMSVDRILNPMKKLAAVTVAIGLIGGTFWLLKVAPQPKVDTPASIPVQIQTLESNLENPNLLPTQTPLASLEPTLTEITPTLAPEEASDSYFDPGYKNQTETKLVDLDCDGRNETLVTNYKISTNPLEMGEGLRYYTSVALLNEDQDNHYQTAWEYNFDYSVKKVRYDLVLFSVSGCEQFIAVSGWDWSSSPKYITQVFRWDGETVSTVLDVPENLMDLTGKIVIPRLDPLDNEDFKLTTFIIGFPDPQKGTCELIYTDYGWNGELFIQVDRRVKPNQNCDGSGG